MVSYLFKMSTKNYKRIYLDYATTTPVDPRVEKEMKRFLALHFGNPGSIHAEGLIAKKAVEEARKKIARLIEVHSDEIIFTSSGTESNNLGILGLMNRFHDEGKTWKDMHAITSLIEHSSVLECFRELERRGVKVDYVSVSKEGIVDLKEIKARLKPNTVLVSVMYANNEIGTIQPIRKISNQIRDFAKGTRHGKLAKPIFHVDASQAPLYLDCAPEHLGADLATFDAQKIYGPKSIGALYIRRGIKVKPLFFGGGQERSLRPGTENVPGIVGFAKAFEIAIADRVKESERLTKLRNYGIKKILEKIPAAELNGSISERLPNNINISIPGIDSEFIVLKLDALGIACSTKSTCMDSDEASYVISALGKGREHSRSSLRFSLGRSTTKAHIDALVKKLLAV